MMLKGMGPHLGRSGRRHHVPVGRQRRAVQGIGIGHRGQRDGANEAIQPDRGRWEGDALLQQREGELGHVGSERAGGPLTDRGTGAEGEDVERVVM